MSFTSPTVPQKALKKKKITKFSQVNGKKERPGVTGVEMVKQTGVYSGTDT